MTRDQIIRQIMACIDLQVDGVMGALDQEPSRAVFFDLFVQAYHQGFITDKSLTVGALLGTLQDQWYTDAEERNLELVDFVELLLLYWHAWQYAWEQYEQRHLAVGMS